MTNSAAAFTTDAENAVYVTNSAAVFTTDAENAPFLKIR
jgi:hypothetical protein